MTDDKNADILLKCLMVLMTLFKGKSIVSRIPSVQPMGKKKNSIYHLKIVGDDDDRS